jgi:hypothetical protein
MEWDGEEMREFDRLSGSSIPEGLKSFLVDQGQGELLKAETTDFSLKGLRLLVPVVQSNMHTGDGIILFPENGKFKLVGEVVHSVKIDDRTCYVGIKLLNSKSLEDYHSMIKDICSKRVVTGS